MITEQYFLKNHVRVVKSFMQAINLPNATTLLYPGLGPPFVTTFEDLVEIIPTKKKKKKILPHVCGGESESPHQPSDY